jgi:LSD1 subclass zinc finger protein
MHVTCRLIASYQVVFVRRTNSNARLCPHCAALNLQGSEQSPNMHCAACTKPFCFHHETQHGKRPCRGLTNEGGSSCLGALSSSFWKRCFTKKCPCCRVPIEKNGGCDHIRCTFCHADFCWFCKKSDSECRSRAHALKIVKKSFLALALLPVAIAAAPLVLVAAGGLAIVHLGSCRSS